MSSGSTRRGNRRGVELRPGAVRAARQEAGLSLRDVALPELSRAAVHLIETGQARPSAKSLKLIAARTGKPIEYFLADGAALPDLASEFSPLTELEVLSSRSDFSALLERAEAVVQSSSDPETRCEAHLHAARAASMLGNAHAGLEHARQAESLASDLNLRCERANAVAWQGVALLQLADPRAPSVLNEALDQAAALEPPSKELEARILTNLGSWFVTKQSWDDAIAAFDAAVRASEETRELARMARAYEGLAHASEARGQLDRANRLIQRAVAIYEMSNNLAAEVRARASFAEVLIHQGRTSAARAQVDKATDLFALSGLVQGRGRLSLLSAEMALADQRPLEADEHLSRAKEMIDRLEDPVAYGELLRLQGRAAPDDRAEYGALFESAIEVFDRAGLDQRANAVRREYAERLEGDGHLDDALGQWKAAAGASDSGTHRLRRIRGA